MTITVIVAKTSHRTTRASSAASNGKESADKSSDYWSAGNYHLVISSKTEDGQCASQVPRKDGTCDSELGHKKNAKMLSHLPHSLNLKFDNMFRDDISMDLFIKTIAGQTDEPGLDAHDGKTDAFFN